jgi:GxxExxY protein
MRVHRGLGPGLLEGIHDKCLAHEFERNGIPFDRQIPLPVLHDGTKFDHGYVADFIVAGEVVVEIKSVEMLLPVHTAQLLTCPRLIGCRVGLLINSNTASLTGGIRRRVP